MKAILSKFPIEWLAVLLAVGYELWTGWRGGNHFVDDAYYYLVTARNYWQSGTYTFDGIHPTNGFQPLWMWICTEVYAIAKDCNVEKQIFIIKCIESIFFIHLFYRLISRCKHTESSRIQPSFQVLLLLYPYTQALFFIGMETTLTAWAMVHLFFAMEKSAWRSVAFWASVLVLCRLDALPFVLFPVFIFHLKKWKYFLLPAATVGGYMAWNMLTTGHFSPISGVLKSSIPFFNPKWQFWVQPIEYAQQTGKWYYPLLAPNMLLFAAILLACGIVFWRKSRGVAHADRRMGLLYGLILCALLGNFLFFQKWEKGIEWWYWIMPCVVLAQGLDVLLRQWRETQRARQLYGLLLGMFVLFYGARWMAQPELPRYVDTRIDWICQHTPLTARFAATDAGDIAFWTSRKVINLDGLMNTFAYQDTLRAGKLGEYLRQNRVDYLLAALDATPTREKMYQMYLPSQQQNTANFAFRVYSYRYHQYSDTVKLPYNTLVFGEKSAPSLLIFALSPAPKAR